MRSMMVAVLLVSLLAGCASESEGTLSTADCDARWQTAVGDGNVTQAQAKDTWQAGGGEWVDSDGDCFADQIEEAAGTNATDAADYPVEFQLGPAVQTTVFQANTGNSVATPLRSFNNGGAFSTDFTPTAAHSGIILELEWQTTGQNTGDLSLWVRDASSGNIPPNDVNDVIMPQQPIAQADGGSPLRIVLEPGVWEADTTYSVLIRASAQPVGVAIDQAATLHIHEFIDMPLDKDHTVLG